MNITDDYAKKLETVVKDTENALKELENLQKKYENFKIQCSNDSELTNLISENSKLKYQRLHLKRAVDKEYAQIQNGKYMISLVATLKSYFKNSLMISFPQLSHCNIEIVPSVKANFGDYQCNSSMSLNAELKKIGMKSNPKDIAEALISNLPISSYELIEKTDIAGPGFINIHLKTRYVLREIIKMLSFGVKPPNVGAKKRVIVDMSSPNIAKEMHVGHLRSTIIGESVSRLCQYVGHDVLKLNHLGDWGTQFGMLITHLMDKYPNYKTQAPPIKNLMEFYRESKIRFDKEEDFKKRAYNAVVQLQAFNEDFLKAWNLICKESYNAFNIIYKYLDIENLINRGESFYQKLMGPTIEILDQSGITEIEDGRKIAWGDNKKGDGIPLTLIKSDGGYTYDTSDMAAIRHRLFDEKADWILYVVDQGQGVHFDIIFQVAQLAGWYDKKVKRVEHVGFGVVLGEDKKKFKTRSGDTIRLIDLLEEGLKRSENKLKDKERDKVLSSEEFKSAKEAIAFGCIKYADLSKVRTNDYIFSFDKMLDDRGNTAVYLLYAYTRIRSISRAAGFTDQQLKSLIKNVNVNNLPLDHPCELRLSKFLLKWPEIIEAIYKSLMFHTLCEYLYDLSGIFTEFYDNCYVIEKDKTTGKIIKINNHRLLLCEGTANIMKAGFDILGLQVVEKM